MQAHPLKPPRIIAEEQAILHALTAQCGLAGSRGLMARDMNNCTSPSIESRLRQVHRN